MRAESFTPTKLSLLTLLLTSMLILMGGAAVAPALPQITDVFPEYGSDMVGMVITLPSLAIAITGLCMGILADRVGKVKVLITSLVIFTLAGVSGFFINDFPTLLASRFFVGVGIAGITSCCTALITEYYNGPDRIRTLGYQTAAMGVGVLILETTGGALANIGWHEPFLVYGIGFVIFMMALISLREPQKKMATENERMIQINKPSLALNYIEIFILMVCVFIMPLKIASYAGTELDMNSTFVGLLLGVNGVLNACACLLYRRITMSIDREQMITLGFAFMGLGLILFIFDASLTQMIISMCICGFGGGLATTGIINMLSEQTCRSNSGKIMGGYTTALNLGQFSCTMIAAVIVSMYGLQHSFVILGIIALIMGAALFMKNKITSQKNTN